MTGTLVPEFTFETLVLGSRNRFAHAAAVAVAEAPGSAYNPLFIYGGPHSGTTHLLHALGNYARQLHPSLDICYVSAAEFASESAIAAYDSRRGEARSRYLAAGMLLIGDIQLLPADEAVQAEFRHVFSTLYDGGKQLVISSDRLPASLDESLRDRLGQGLLAEVQPPELETRIAILRRQAIREGFNAPPEVLEYIASRIPADITELEGALIKVTAFASLNRQLVDLQLAENVLKDLVPEA